MERETRRLGKSRSNDLIIEACSIELRLDYVKFVLVDEPVKINGIDALPTHGQRDVSCRKKVEGERIAQSRCEPYEIHELCVRIGSTRQKG